MAAISVVIQRLTWCMMLAMAAGVTLGQGWDLDDHVAVVGGDGDRVYLTTLDGTLDWAESLGQTWTLLNGFPSRFRQQGRHVRPGFFQLAHLRLGQRGTAVSFHATRPLARGQVACEMGLKHIFTQQGVVNPNHPSEGSVNVPF